MTTRQSIRLIDKALVAETPSGVLTKYHFIIMEKKQHAVKFVDSFSFAVMYVLAGLTEEQVKQINVGITIGEPVHRESKNGIAFAWIPLKVIDLTTPEGQQYMNAEKLINSSATILQ